MNCAELRAEVADGSFDLLPFPPERYACDVDGRTLVLGDGSDVGVLTAC